MVARVDPPGPRGSRTSTEPDDDTMRVGDALSCPATSERTDTVGTLPGTSDEDLGEEEMHSVVAYIDAGTGSYLLTAIAGGFAAIWFFLRGKLDRLLGRTRKEGPVDEEGVSAAKPAGEATSRTATETPPPKPE